jgi:hypothetical protein
VAECGSTVERVVVAGGSLRNDSGAGRLLSKVEVTEESIVNVGWYIFQESGCENLELKRSSSCWLVRCFDREQVSAIRLVTPEIQKEVLW